MSESKGSANFTHKPTVININLKNNPNKQQGKSLNDAKEQTLKNLAEKITLEKHKAAQTAKTNEQGEAIQTLSGRQIVLKNQPEVNLPTRSMLVPCTTTAGRIAPAIKTVKNKNIPAKKKALKQKKKRNRQQHPQRKPMYGDMTSTGQNVTGNLQPPGVEGQQHFPYVPAVPFHPDMAANPYLPEQLPGNQAPLPIHNYQPLYNHAPQHQPQGLDIYSDMINVGQKLAETFQPPGVDGPQHYPSMACEPIAFPYVPAAQYLPEAAVKPFPTVNEQLPDMPLNLFHNNVVPKRRYPGASPVQASEDREVIIEPEKKKIIINLHKKPDTKPQQDFNKFELDPPPVFISTIDRPEIKASTDESVRYWRSRWPWLTKMEILESVSPKTSQASLQSYSDRFLHRFFDGKKGWVKVFVRGYPPDSTMEFVMNAILKAVNSKCIPCFIEFSQSECKFFLNDCIKVVKALIKLQFRITISGTCRISLTVSHLINELDFDYKKVIAKWMAESKESDFLAKKVDMSNFLKIDRSFLIYFPLNNPINQRILMTFHPHTDWSKAKELDLSNNALESISELKLQDNCPHLKVLDLSKNNLGTILELKSLHQLEVTRLTLEGNPLCWNYIDPTEYVDLSRLIFPTLTNLDGVNVKPGELVPSKQHYSCDTNEAPVIVDQFLQTYWPLLDSKKDRGYVEELYHSDATLTMTCDVEMKREQLYNPLAPFFSMCLNKTKFSSDHGSVVGAFNIAKRIKKWPQTLHDYGSFNVDIVMHSEQNTIVVVNGIFKVPSTSLMSEEPMIRFARTFLLNTTDGIEYKIVNDLFYIQPAEDRQHAFFLQQVKPLEVNLKLESAPTEEMKEELIGIFMKITKSKRKTAESCLVMRNWDLSVALEYFITLEC